MQTISISIPTSLRSRFLTYGPRATSGSISTRSAPPRAQDPSTENKGFLDYLATWQVPHSYFTHFYVASVLSSVFWVAQLLSRGVVFQAIASRVSEDHQRHSMSPDSVGDLLCAVGCTGIPASMGVLCLFKAFVVTDVVYALAVGLGFLSGGRSCNLDRGFRHSVDRKSEHCPSADDQRPKFAHFLPRPALPGDVWSAARLPSLPVLVEKIHPPRASHVPRYCLSPLRR